MAKIDVECPECGETQVIKHGKTPKGAQRYLCQNEKCQKATFLLDYAYNGWKPTIEKQIIKMTANASGIRDISRVLEISTDKVMATLKNETYNK